MLKMHTYIDKASYMLYDVRWMLILDNQTVSVTCQDENRKYTIEEPVTDFKVEDNYVFIYVDDPKVSYYQFKFESDMFFVGDKFDANDEFIDEFACHVFNEN
jgi:hypothetical protein